MSQDDLPNLREKDEVVLIQIADGHYDTQQITAATILKNPEVNYCFTKLAKQGLIEVKTPDGYVERMIDGQKRVFRAPKQAALTEAGTAYVQHCDADELPPFNDLSRAELIAEFHDHTERIEDLEIAIRTLKKQVKNQTRD